MFTIEQGLPLPKRTGRGGHAVYPFENLNVGDSFFVPGISSGKITSAGSYWKKKLGWKFTVRRQGEGVRVWRIE